MAFDKDIPATGTSLRASNPEILANQSQIQTGVNNEHIFSGTSAGTQTGDHTQGSARCFSQAGAPATRIDGNVFLSTDLGSLWIDTDDNAMYILTATVPTWTPVSTEVIATLLAANRIFAGTLGVTGDFAVNTNKFTVAAATGNALFAGTLDVTGNIDPTSYEGTNGGFLDEDAMGSDAADKVASQQSIKAYADASPAAQMTPTAESDDTGTTGVTVLANGLRIARGQEAVGGAGNKTVTPSGFTKIYHVSATIIEDNNTDRQPAKLGAIDDTTFRIRNTTAVTLTYSWFCIGR